MFVNQHHSNLQNASMYMNAEQLSMMNMGMAGLQGNLANTFIYSGNPIGLQTRL